MRYIKVTTVRALAHQAGRRVSPSYLQHLDAMIEAKVKRDSALLRGRITLNAEHGHASETAKGLARTSRRM